MFWGKSFNRDVDVVFRVFVGEVVKIFCTSDHSSTNLMKSGEKLWYLMNISIFTAILKKKRFFNPPNSTLGGFPRFKAFDCFFKKLSTLAQRRFMALFDITTTTVQKSNYGMTWLWFTVTEMWGMTSLQQIQQEIIHIHSNTRLQMRQIASFK